LDVRVRVAGGFGAAAGAWDGKLAGAAVRGLKQPQRGGRKQATTRFLISV